MTESWTRASATWVVVVLCSSLCWMGSAVAQGLCEDAVRSEEHFAACRRALGAGRGCEALKACVEAERLCPSGGPTFSTSRARALATCEQRCTEDGSCLGVGWVCRQGRCVADPQAEERVLSLMLKASESVDPCSARSLLTEASAMARDAGLSDRLRMLSAHLSASASQCERRSGQSGVALVGRDGAPMVLVSGGPYWRGSTDDEVEKGLAVCRASYASPDDCTVAWFERETPRREIDLSPFYIDVYEVTNDRYRRCVEGGGCEAAQYDRCEMFDAASETLVRGGPAPDTVLAGDHPVVCVTWRQAQSYCEWAGKRLPTEAEWEKAARGTDGRQFPWGESWEPEALNWGEPVGYGSVDGHVGASPVGSFPQGRSPYGALDMAGNVWEWTLDWHGEDFYSRSAARDPRNEEVSGFKVLRGGSWRFAGNGARASFRYLHSPTAREDTIGLRCVLGRP